MKQTAWKKTAWELLSAAVFGLVACPILATLAGTIVGFTAFVPRQWLPGEFFTDLRGAVLLGFAYSLGFGAPLGLLLGLFIAWPLRSIPLWKKSVVLVAGTLRDLIKIKLPSSFAGIAYNSSRL